MLKFSDIDFSYTEGVKNLDKISAVIERGELVAIAGRNGSGKTTLTRALMGLLKPQGGTILLNGTAITELSAAERARYIGYVFQNPDRQLFAASVREETAYAPRQLGFHEEAVNEAVARALSDTSLSEMADEIPQLLSRGEKQRLAIASALAAGPEILILDEPTSGQDCRERVSLLRLLRNLKKKGITIFLVTHDMDIIAEHADRVLVLEKGALKFSGTARQLFSDEAMTLNLGLELPEAVKIGRELNLGLCLTPTEVYEKLKKGAQRDE